MAEVRKIIRAFLASPGDLQEERESIRGMVKDWNEAWADHLGYQIELMGWKRWGIPPDKDGKYSSGFQEEYERSVERREKLK